MRYNWSIFRAVFTARPAKSQGLFWSPKCLEEKFEIYWREKHANEEKEQNSEVDIPNFTVGFFEF